MSDGSKGPLPTEASKANEMTSKPGFGLCSGMSLGVTRLVEEQTKPAGGVIFTTS